jgi:hypothetical protein
MMRDPRVPITKKVAALGVGIGVTVMLLILQIPLEGILSIVAPFIGLAADVAIDGLEVVALPFLLALAMLPLIHQERNVAHVGIQSR